MNPESSPRRCQLLRPLLISLCLLLWGCSRHSSTDTGAQDEAPSIDMPSTSLRISQRNEPGDLDPATASIPDEFFILRALSEGLVTPASDGALPQPAAADRWDIRDDGLTYVFHLRPSTWSNGDRVTAQDFFDSYRRALDPATACPKVSHFFMIAGAEAFATGKSKDFASVGIKVLSEDVLEIRLARPTPRFLYYAATGTWLPVHIATVHQFGKDWTKPGNFVGNGAFTLAEWQPHQRIVVHKRNAYWDAANIHLKSIQFIAFDNGEAEERAFRAGQIDITMSIPSAKIPVYRSQAAKHLRQAPLQETRYLAFNTTKAPLNDLRVRQALSLALDRSAITQKVLTGGQTPAFRLLHPALARVPQSGAPHESVEEARHLLAEAGYPNGQNFPKLELAGWTNQPVLEAIQDMWRTRLGIDVTLAMNDAKVHVSNLRSGHYDIGFIVAIPDVDDPLVLLSEFRSDAPGNYPHFKDGHYDELVHHLQDAPTPAEADQAMLSAEEYLLQKAPLAPLYFNTRAYLIRPRVKAWTEDGLWNRFYKYVTLTKLSEVIPE